jgi:dimethylglycine dehydrogenase
MAVKSGALPVRARVAVIGGGVAGCSVLYHLARMGCDGLILLEASELTSGSTWHAAGLCTQFHSSINVMKLLRYSVELYDGTLEADTGQPVGYHRCGSVRLGTSPDRLDEFLHRRGMAESAGVPFEIIDPGRAAELFPLAALDGVTSAAYLPTDGHVDPSGVTSALAQGAKRRGARILRNVRVTALRFNAGRWTVSSTAGTVVADVVVNAAGQWAREVGRLAGVELPVSPLAHQYLTTAPVPEVQALSRELPVLRDPGNSFYVRQEGQGLLIGPFERNPAAWALDGIPEGFHGRLLPPDLERIEDVLAAVADRVPVFGKAGIQSVVNGPDGYTPDGLCLMGPVPGLRNFHVLAGFSIFGIVFGGGAGKYAAEWIMDGQPGDSMWDLDVRRFGSYAGPVPYTVARARETYEREYAIRFPHEELPGARPLKTDPIYDRLAMKGAVFGSRSGWERPLWFSTGRADRADQPEKTFRRPDWHQDVAAECRAVRSGAGILDQTSFAKYEVRGPQAAALLDRLCAGRLPRRDGRIALTQMCNERGGIECDITVTRLARDRFYLVSAAATETHDLDWIASHLPERGACIDNVTSQLGVLTLAGPSARQLLARVASADCSDGGLEFFGAAGMRIGMAPATVMRLSRVGELGYELHHPLEYQRYLYDLLHEAGADLGITDFGYLALESMRLEKCYRLWGADLSSDVTPLEAGLERFVHLDKGDFIGHDALARQSAEGTRQTLSCLRIETHDADAYRYEPILRGDRQVGYVTSGGYGHTVQASLALAYLPADCAGPGTQLTVKILGCLCPATVVPQPVFDPGNTRLAIGR